jgi:hypothetical protein
MRPQILGSCAAILAEPSRGSASSIEVRQARWLHLAGAMRAQQPHASAILATGATPMPIEAGVRRERSHPALRLPGSHTPEPADARRLTGLADLVDEVAACLDQPTDEPLRAAMDRCNTELESYLEVQRAREPRAGGAQDELRGLARQLRSERADATLVARRIRRVLGRVDAHRKGDGEGT